MRSTKIQSIVNTGISKLLIVIPFWFEDRSQAMALAQLIADIEPGLSLYADLAFFARWDCAQDEILAEKIRSKFASVHLLRSQRQVAGWPMGANAMEMDLFKIVYEKTSNREWAYDAILQVEPDCVPLRLTWLKELYDDWRSGTQLALGPVFGNATNLGQSHMNGGAWLFSPTLTPLVAEIWQQAEVPTRALDWCLWPVCAPWARASRLIYSEYGLGVLPERPWRGCDFLWEPKTHRDEGNPLKNVELLPCLLHGTKTLDGIACVRQKFNLP